MSDEQEKQQDEYKVDVRRDTPSDDALLGEMEQTGAPDGIKTHEEPVDEPSLQPSQTLDVQSVTIPAMVPVASAPIAVAAPTTTSEVHMPVSSGTLILQWLTYAFWFWFGISMSWLAGVVINYFISDGSYGIWENLLAYPLAAVIVMMIIALVTDLVYARREPAHKTGAANVIMLLHAVPFILIGIGSLITIVFSLITMALDSSPFSAIDGPLQALYVALVVIVIYGLLAYRVIFGGRKAIARWLTRVLLGVIALGFIIAASAGPAVQSSLTKQDRLIETALPLLSEEIRNYTEENGKLPDSFADMERGTTAEPELVQKVIDQNLVTYKPNTLQSGLVPRYDMDSFSESTVGRDEESRFYYQLCTTFKVEKKSSYGSGYGEDRSVIAPGEETTIADYPYDQMYVTEHPAGEACYGLYADESRPY